MALDLTVPTGGADIRYIAFPPESTPRDYWAPILCFHIAFVFTFFTFIQVSI